MAGLNRDYHTPKVYVTISNGKFVQRVGEGTDGAIERVIENKKDKTTKRVWELIYADIEAYIESVEVDESGNYGDQLKLNMAYMDEKFTLTLPMNGREAKSFLCVLPNIDISQMIALKPYNFVDKSTGKSVIGMNTMQGGKTKENKVAPYFSKETPNGLPQVPEAVDIDEFKLAMKSQEIFLKKFTKKFAEENFKSKRVFAEPAKEETFENDSDGALPF